MRFERRRQAFLASVALLSGASKPSDSRFQAAPEFLFERRPFQSNCVERPKGTAYLTFGSRLPFQRKQAKNLTFPLVDIPALTLTADESGQIRISGGPQESWSLDLCAQGEGETELEAVAQVHGASIERIGGTISLTSAAAGDRSRSSHTLLVKAPAAGPIVVHASFTAVQVEDMTAPVRVTATHARATILDTTGKVDAAAFVVDYAGSEGTVKLTSENDINVKLRASRFKGSLMAWSQGPVKVLLPASFQTPFVAIVNRPKDFACRADLCSKVTLQKQGSLCLFTYAGDGSAPPQTVQFRSELQTVVIDNGT